MKTFKLVFLLVAVCGFTAYAESHSDSVTIGKTTYQVANGDYVIGTDKVVYQWMGVMSGGKVALKEVPTMGWLSSDETKSSTASTEVISKDVSFISEVELKDCGNLCQGNKVFQKSGGQVATVDRVFSGGTMTVFKSTTNSIGIITGHALMMTMAADVVKQDTFMMRNRGVAGGGPR